VFFSGILKQIVEFLSPIPILDAVEVPEDD
jgi:hypothetical protein